jgi:hypothetical protein
MLKIEGIDAGVANRGHKKISIFVTGTLSDVYGEEKEVEFYELKCTTTNTLATDCYYDDNYDNDIENEDRFYECRYEAGESIVDEVFMKNDIDLTLKYVIQNIPTLEEVIELREEIKREREE